jgi:hypothetical protein
MSTGLFRRVVNTLAATFGAPRHARAEREREYRAVLAASR